MPGPDFFDVFGVIWPLFMLIMFLHCLFNKRLQGGQKLMWSLIILFAQGFGAVAYLIVGIILPDRQQRTAYQPPRYRYRQPQAPYQPPQPPQSTYEPYQQGYQAQPTTTNNPDIMKQYEPDDEAPEPSTYEEQPQAMYPQELQ